MIKRSFTFRSGDMIVTLYKSLILKNINMLEKAQHRATKLVPGLEKLTYEERLDLLGLTT